MMYHFVKPLVRISSLDYILARELSFGKIKGKKKCGSRNRNFTVSNGC